MHIANNLTKAMTFKVTTIGFYYDFTRFFSKLHSKEMSRNRTVDVVNYATHASGYIFECAKGMKRVLLPFAVRMRKRKTQLADDELSWIGQYLEAMRVSKIRSREISRKYVSYFLYAFAQNRPDVVIISGDTRMQSRAAAYACKALGIRHYYFEQGPFGTTILDSKGVNCTASFAKKFHTHSMAVADEPVLGDLPLSANVKVKERKLVRAIDYLLQPIFLLFGFLEIREEKPFMKQLARQIWAFSRRRRKVVDEYSQETEPFVLIVGQVPTDANFSLNSPYSSFLQLVNDVEQMFPEINILFREHPLYIGSYGVDFYNHFENEKRLKLSRGTRLDSEIDRASYIVVVNSTAGMEVILKHRKPLLCLGDASYAHLHGVYNRENLSGYLTSVKRIDDASHYANCRWFSESFIQGHFRDKDLNPLVTNVLRKIDEN